MSSTITITNTIDKVFRDATEESLEPYRCTPSLQNELFPIFSCFYNTRIKSFVIVGDETEVHIPDQEVPVGIIYQRRKYYAVGISNTTGRIDLSKINIPVPVTLNYKLYGGYQRDPMSCSNVLDHLNWRRDFIMKPIFIQKKDIIKFERSRWLLFTFWAYDLEQLIRLEFGLLDKLVKITKRKGGKLHISLPKIHGLKTIKEVEGMIKEQYKCKMSFTDSEKRAIFNLKIFEHVKNIFKKWSI